MKLYLTYHPTKTFKAFLQEQLNVLEVDYTLVGTNEIKFKEKQSQELINELQIKLESYGITLTSDQNIIIVDKIKSEIEDMIASEAIRKYNLSDYLSDRLNYSYSYLSNLFSETTYTSIENYVILSKIDRAKDLLVHTNATLTEIAYQLNYSSVAHLSRQFKKTTGLTPSAFQTIIKKRQQKS